MDWIKNVFDLFYPHFCYGCDEVLHNGNDILCSNCLMNLDFIPLTLNNNTEMKRRFYGKLSTEHCLATLYFSEKSIVQKLLHELKYKNQQKISAFFATLTLQHLKNHEVFNWIDFVVCIPLHQSKEKKRGYNQLDGFGNELSKQLNIPFYKDYLIKTTKTKTQTKKSMWQRAESKSEFIVNAKYENLQNKNILLIDDVMTTGSTLEIAGKCILKNSTNKISVLTMAYTR
ncbi:ComF family protein [Flavobacterium dauae]|uniref:ComF family protein n=1 Tax=Flavobacterium dauae TaxID=1563479 RepID=UPI00101B51D1|nr:phosphoribosyltransferase family protein [Flavobacterium dauae]WLD24126.1 ComF family protein [Flavobacterium dauae]